MKISTIIIAILLVGAGFYLGNNSKEYSENPDNNLQRVLLKGEVDNSTDASGEAEEDKSDYTAEEEGFSDIAAAFSNQEEATIALFDRSAPSVVFITTSTYQQDRWSMNVFEIPKGSGTGFLWDADGHIVTNYHVIQGGNRVTVTLADQTSYEASVVGVEPNKDLAVLRIITPGRKIKPLPAGRSNDLRVGQSVFAIGNPFGLDQSLTTGIISALGREIDAENGRKIMDVIQTDAAINPGNSGGPLLDSSGRVIGVNTAIYSPSGASAGIGFSIPIDVVRFVVPDLIKYGEVRRPVIGIELVSQQSHNSKGSMIMDVAPNSPASKAGLRGVQRGSTGMFIPGDLIIQIDNYKIESNNDLILALENFKIGDEISLKVRRKEGVKQVELKLASNIRN